MKASKLAYRGKNPDGDPYFIKNEVYDVWLADIELDDIMLAIGQTVTTGFKVKISKRFVESGCYISKTLIYKSLGDFLRDWRLPGGVVCLTDKKGTRDEA